MKHLIETLNPMDYYTEEDLCKECKYKHSFLCDKRYAEGIVTHYFQQYGIHIYAYDFSTNDLRKIIDKIHSKELEHHRNGEYFALQATNFHCGDSCDCQCDKTRCWHFDKVQSRRQPHCIKFFGIKLPEHLTKNNIAFILGNENYGGINKC